MLVNVLQLQLVCKQHCKLYGTCLDHLQVRNLIFKSLYLVFHKELVSRRKLLLKHFTLPLDGIQAQNGFFLILQVIMRLISLDLLHSACNEDENLRFWQDYHHQIKS